jgi:integrase
MPLKLRAPRAGKTPNFEIRGTYLGVRVEVSSGADKRSVALKQLRRIQECIEDHGRYPAPELKRTGEPTFLSAANAYMQAGGKRKYVAPLIRRIAETPLSQVTQKLIDDVAAELYPNVSPATRNCYVYTPASAILHHALGNKCPVIRRPKGAKGKVKTDFLWPVDAFAIIEEADKIDLEFGLYLLQLLYTGIRKSEGLNILSADVHPGELAAWIRDSKNDDPRMLKLRKDLADRLKAHLDANPGRERLFRFREGGHFKHMLLRAKLAVCGLPCPTRRPTGWKPPEYRLSYVGFHTFRHTWATWMRRYGNTDVQGLAATGNWRDPRSAGRTSFRGRNGTVWKVSQQWGLNGEKQEVSEIMQSNQRMDLSPPRAGRNFFGDA